MSSRAKGRRNELRCVLELQKRGYEVYLIPTQRRFDKVVDIFGLWDMVARRKSDGRLLFVQSKTNRKPPASYVRQLEECLLQADKELWVWTDRKRQPNIIVVR